MTRLINQVIVVMEVFHRIRPGEAPELIAEKIFLMPVLNTSIEILLKKNRFISTS